MTVYIQDKKRWEEFLKDLMTEYEVVAPVKKDLVRFLPITDPKDVHLEKNAYFPLKEFFFRKNEVLFTFDRKGFTTPKIDPPKRVFFGIRRCDLNAILHQDQVFRHDIHDPYYEEWRKNSLFFGYHCPQAPSEHCFCASLGLKDFHDLMYYDRGDHFLVEVGSEKGEKIIKHHTQSFTSTNKTLNADDRHIPGADSLKRTDIAPLYHHPDWKKGIDICFSCAACTNLCPTCYCFEIHDDVSTKDPSKGQRMRQWSSCQLQSFTKVAGEHVYREKREERFKHRIYHQLDYFREKHGNALCVGCARCIDGCPTRIDFVKIINEARQ